MEQGKDLRILFLKSLAVMGLWTIVIFLISSITFLTFLQEGYSMGVFEIIVYELFCISPWIILTPAIIRVARSYRFKNNAFYSIIGIHLITVAVVFSLHSFVQSYTNSLYYDMSFSWSYIQRDFLGYLDMRIMLYIGILLAVYTIDFQKKNREIRLSEPRLKAELNKAKFHALLNQVQPDFLLNSIESIKDNLDDNKERSEEILNDFSDLLRIMLANVNREEVTVQEDLESFYLYTGILQKRLGQNIDIETSVDEACHDAIVPSFLMLVPVFEQILAVIDSKSDSIRRICYKARCQSGKIHSETRIEGKNIPYKSVPKLIQNLGFTEIIEKLQSKYGKHVEFKTQTEKDSIYFSLVMPYLVSEGKSNAGFKKGKEEMSGIYI